MPPISAHTHHALAAFVAAFLLATTTTAAPAATSTTTVTYWDEERPEIQSALDRFASEFERTHPSTKIRRSHYSTEDLRIQFQTATLGGGGPSLLLAPGDFAGVFAAMKTIQPITTPLSHFSPQLIEGITNPSDPSNPSAPTGKPWGIPLNAGNHLALYYNKKLVPTPPATLEDLIALSPSLTNPKTGHYALAFHVLEPYWFAPFLGCFGERPLVNSRPNLDTPGMAAALQLVHDLRYKHRIIPDSCDYACAEVLFVEGKAAMTINGDWAIAKFASALKSDLGIAPLPSLKATGKPMTTMNGGKYFFFNAKLKPEALAAARAFVDFMTSPDVQRRLALETKRLPSLAALSSDPAITGDPLLAASLAAAKNAYPMPIQVEMRAVWDAIRPQLQEVMADRAKPKDAARAMQKDAEAKIHAIGG